MFQMPRSYDAAKLDTPARLDGVVGSDGPEEGDPMETDYRRDNQARPVLRANWGSYPAVERVFAYDPRLGVALVLYRHADGSGHLGEATTAELEAVKPDRTFADADAILRQRAEFLLPGWDDGDHPGGGPVG
jgi:hypothetical protein